MRRTRLDKLLSENGLSRKQAGQVIRAGRVRVDGVDWRAVCDTPLEAGTRCRVTAVGATTLTVEPLPVPSHSAT